MSGIRVKSSPFECLACGTQDAVLGTPGQTVTVERKCAKCGGKIKISFTFPKE